MKHPYYDADGHVHFSPFVRARRRWGILWVVEIPCGYYGGQWEEIGRAITYQGAARIAQSVMAFEMARTREVAG